MTTPHSKLTVTRWIGQNLPALLVSVAGLIPVKTWACFPSENAQPSNEVSELSLAQRPGEPAVVYTKGSYAIYVTPSDIIEAMGSRSSTYGTGTFSDRLRSLQPLTKDIDTHEILVALAPEMPTEKEITEKALHYNRFWGQSDQQLMYAIATLIENGRAAVVNPSSGEALSSLTRNKYSEICSGGRKFITSTGELLLETLDWIS